MIVGVAFTPGILALYVHNKTMKKTQLFLDSHQSRDLKNFSWQLYRSRYTYFKKQVSNFHENRVFKSSFSKYPRLSLDS